jgi:hypothetical protein
MNQRITASLSAFNASLTAEDNESIMYIICNARFHMLHIRETTLAKYYDTDEDISYYNPRSDPIFYNKSIAAIPYDLHSIIYDYIIRDITGEEIFSYRYNADKLSDFIGEKMIENFELRRRYIRYMADKLANNLRELYKPYTHNHIILYCELEFLRKEFELFIYGRV